MITIKTKLYTTVLFLVSLCIQAQEIPPINIFSNSAYDAESQNWSISQGPNKSIYIANNNGLLEFDGARWQLYPSPNNTIIRSVKVVDDRIYTGCYMEFGYWKRNAFGLLEYTSLSDQMKTEFIEDEQFWTIIDLDQWVLFQSLDRIYIYNINDETFQIIESETRLTKMFEVDGMIYFQKLNDGLYKIENGTAKVVNVDKVIRENILVNILDINNILIFQTRDKGFYVLKDNLVQPWHIPSKDLLEEISVYSSIKLSDGRFALGTISNGIIFLNADGTLESSINHSKGLSNNTVLSVFEDFDSNIWLGLDKGINCINLESPFRIFKDKDGTLGTVYASAILNGNLYLGTNQGLFYKSHNSNSDFTFVEGTKGQVWNLTIIGDTLFCGHDEGTFVINNNKVTRVGEQRGTWNFKRINDVIIQGNYDGLYVLENDNGNWNVRNKIKGFDMSSKYLELIDASTLLVNHEYKGVYKLNLSEDLSEVLEISRDTTVNKGLNSSLVKYQDHIYYAYPKGVYKYDIEKNEFLKDELLSKFYDDGSYITGKLVVDSENARLWGFSKNQISYSSQSGLSDDLDINSISLPYSIGNMMVGYENILFVENDTYLLGTSEGYVLIDLDKNIEQSFEVSITGIRNYDLNSSKQRVDMSQNQMFENEFNNLEFEYRAPVYDKYGSPQYQYQLEGIYDNWSEWSAQSQVLFKNLPHGKYTLNVRARSGNTLSQNVVSYSFQIEKPWYLSTMMIIIYVLGLILISIVIHNLYQGYYRKQKEQLVVQNRRDIELKELENQQELMQLKNDKLRQDIENKNRELAISTMSLIKKNEFLSSIKEELKNASKTDQINPVIKIIDKNLNNTDDWKFFQEAFNNADKDFLKKVKSKHPNLTPNDLKLCAYLRLNLSSKEIAPLLNISPRSVEVKRYRLRKKMDLPHESSLTNYILEI